ARGWAEMGRGPGACPVCLRSTVGLPTIPIPAGLPLPFRRAKSSTMPIFTPRSNPCRAPPSFSTFKVGVTYGGSPEFQSLPGSPFLFDEDRSARLHPDCCKFQSLTGSPFLFDG